MISSAKNEILDILGKNLPGVIFYRFIRSKKGEIVFDYISENAEQFTGHSTTEIIANPQYLFGTALPEYNSILKEKQEESFENFSIFNIELECQSAHDGIRWVKITSTPEKLNDGNIAWVGIQTDITESKRGEFKLQKYNRELQLLNNINDIINNTDDEESLYELICSCLITKGNYKLAWICHAPSPFEISHKVIPISASGEVEYLNMINIDMDNDTMRKGPTAHVLLNGGIVINNNVETNGLFKPWLEMANRFNIRSSIVLELNIYEDRRSAICIYSSAFDAFDEKEVLILDRMARNVSTAIKNINIEIDKREAKHQLNERVKELSTIYSINKILQHSNLPIGENIQDIANIIPMGWQFPQSCVARITFNNTIYYSANFEESNWSIGSEITINKKTHGKVEVFYTREMKLEAEGPFLKEERILLNTIAETIGLHFEKENANQQLISSEANLKSIFNHTDVGYLLLDINYNIISYNEKIINGYLSDTSIKATIGLNFLDIVDSDRKKYIEKILKDTATNRVPIEYEFNYRKRINSNYYNVMVVPIFDINKVIGICISAYDITKRRNEEIIKEKVTNELLQRNRDLEQFAYIVSHNLRAPVANILGLNTLLKDDPTEVEKVDIINKLNTSTERLDSVIKDLNIILQVKREISEIKEEIDFELLIEHVKESLSNTIAQQHVEFQCDFSSALKINSIKTYLGSIFFNLITNSIKYARADTRVIISIKTEKNNDNIIIHFKDNCQGIDLGKYGDQVFGLYKKFNTNVEGKGIGLFMVKTQVEVLGGKISISSVLNAGTEFTITFPIL
jgi:PAS domain S-box-containing protein